MTVPPGRNRADRLARYKRAYRATVPLKRHTVAGTVPGPSDRAGRLAWFGGNERGARLGDRPRPPSPTHREPREAEGEEEAGGGLGDKLRDQSSCI